MDPPQTQRRAILPRCKTDLFAEWIDGNRILEHSFNHFQIKNFNVYLSLYCLMVFHQNKAFGLHFESRDSSV
jgi:hypothetical protein